MGSLSENYCVRYPKPVLGLGLDSGCARKRHICRACLRLANIMAFARSFAHTKLHFICTEWTTRGKIALAGLRIIGHIYIYICIWTTIRAMLFYGLNFIELKWRLFRARVAKQTKNDEQTKLKIVLPIWITQFERYYLLIYPLVCFVRLFVCLLACFNAKDQYTWLAFGVPFKCQCVAICHMRHKFQI